MLRVLFLLIKSAAILLSNCMQTFAQLDKPTSVASGGTTEV